MHKLQNTEPFVYYIAVYTSVSYCIVEITCCLFYSSVHSIDATITVDIGSCDETSPGVYLNPGNTVILNCSVTNPSNLNILIWNVPIGGASSFLLNSGSSIVSNSVFSATLISADDDAKTISSQLMFTASEILDEMKVACANNENPQSEDNCTLLVTSK